MSFFFIIDFARGGQLKKKFYKHVPLDSLVNIPWIQHENDNVHDLTMLLCVHSLGNPNTECKIPF